MIDLAIFFGMVVFYFWDRESNTARKEACLAMLAYVAYTILYRYIPPFPLGTSLHMQQLYGLIPLLSFGAIVFPHVNSQSPELVTRIIGWSGLVVVTFTLICFKLFVWSSGA